MARKPSGYASEPFGHRYAHIAIWQRHHQAKVRDGYIIHHQDENKRNNAVCTNPPGCPVMNCGNLEELTRKAHILQHKPGRMGGRKLKSKKPITPGFFTCENCGKWSRTIRYFGYVRICRKCQAKGVS